MQWGHQSNWNLYLGHNNWPWSIIHSTQKAHVSSYFWQKSCPQFLQWCRLSVRENRTEQLEQLSLPSSFTQWSAAERPGWSLTDQLKTRPRLSPTRILLWSLQETQEGLWSSVGVCFGVGAGEGHEGPLNSLRGKNMLEETEIVLSPNLLFHYFLWTELCCIFEEHRGRCFIKLRIELNPHRGKFPLQRMSIKCFPQGRNMCTLTMQVTWRKYGRSLILTWRCPVRWLQLGVCCPFEWRLCA